MKTRPRPAKGRLAGRLAAVAGAAAALLLAAELAVRVLHPMDALVYQDSEDPLLSTELRPGASGLKNGVEVSVSAQGLRDEPVESPRPKDERRVVVVGGHETFGVGVPVESTYVRELADGLVDPADGRARTVNLSMYSYGLAQKVELACRRLRELEPEVAVLQVSEGDAGSPAPPLFRLARIKNWLRENSALVRWTAEAWYLRPRPKSLPAEDFEAERRELLRFADCAGAAGARAALMYLPDVSRPAASSPAALRRAAESVAKEKGLPFLDGGPALRAVPAAERTAFPGTRFLSPAAHRALSGALRAVLKPLLKRRPAKKLPRRPVA
ncbi:MAG TPA: hypothetical protein VN915_04045 [Elusimicrobiota bacterium]|nr:hypothetical protein [Elusimicrobiota bacterium]